MINDESSGPQRHVMPIPYDLARKGNSVQATIADVIGGVAIAYAISIFFATAAQRCGQPAVIGQIFAGILLGPSLLGRLPGHLTGHLFPQQVLPYLTVVSQIAVVIFMFGVGYEIDFRALGRYGRTVPLIALGSFVVPVGLGMASVLVLHPEFSAIGEAHPDRSLILFLGVATSITALPVLAAIVRDKNIAGTVAGVIATAAAGMMDVAAWLVLAATLIGSGHSGRFSLPVTLLLLGGLITTMLLIIRPIVGWLADRRHPLMPELVPVAFALSMASAWVTATLGLQPVFGAFLAGLAMRGGRMRPDADVVRSIDHAGSLLLPLFFMVTGLSLNISGLSGDGLIVLAVIVAAASVGKLGPSYAISRLGGLGPRDASTIAALVNTRGLTELIALNLGFEDGIIDQRLYTVLVIMALITTTMTGPLLSVIQPNRVAKHPAEELVT